jgi:molybdate transport system substrate-binding protein
LSRLRPARLLSVWLLLGPWPGAPAGEPPVRVSVAVSLRPAVEDAVAGYRVARPGVEVVLNSGASGVLLQQVLRGAPSDALISASPREIDRLLDEGLVLEATRRRIASNSLVVVVPRASAPPARLRDLAGSDFAALSVANPKTAPLGRYTRQALEAASLWSRLGPRLVLAENARQTLDYVARGEVEAGIVYATDARLLAARLRIGPAIPVELHEPIAYEAVVLVDARRPEEAAALLDWLASESGREPFARRGFLPP